MANVLSQIHTYGDTLQVVASAPLGAPAITSPLVSAMPALWGAFGWCSDDGVSESKTFNSTKKYGWQGGAQLADLRNQFENPFTVTALEDNPVTALLRNPAGSTSTVAGSAEVQTVTITGTPTGGTFTLIHPKYGASSAEAYNITTTALASDLLTKWGITVAVTGSAGSSYVLTFPAAIGNTAQASIVTALTGGTSPAGSVATTTPGVSPVNTTLVLPQSQVNRRQFAVYLIDGLIHHCFYIQSGEAVQTGDSVYKGDDFTAYQFTITPSPASDGSFYQDINDDPVRAAGLYL